MKVGVSGHIRLPAEDIDELTEIVSAKMESDLMTPWTLCSSLAEGADRLVTRAALQYGAELHAVLPMAPQDYEKDFDLEESKEEFQRFLTLAQAVHFPRRLESDVVPYAASDRFIASHSDQIIALWDGLDTDFPAGTSRVIEWAIEQGKPIWHLKVRRQGQTKSSDWGTWRRISR